MLFSTFKGFAEISKVHNVKAKVGLHKLTGVPAGIFLPAVTAVIIFIASTRIRSSELSLEMRNLKRMKN